MRIVSLDERVGYLRRPDGWMDGGNAVGSDQLLTNLIDVLPVQILINTARRI